MHKMQCLVILLLKILAAKAYHSHHLHPLPSHNSKLHDPRTVQIKERGPTQVFNRETRDKPHYAENAEIRQYSSQRSLSEPVERDRNNQYYSEDNREKYLELLLKRSGKQHLETELRKTSDDSSRPIKYSLKEGRSSKNDKIHGDNYFERQSQPAYYDNASKERHYLQMQSRMPQNIQQSHTTYEERSPNTENNRNVRHESADSNESSREYPRYYQQDERLNERPMRYSQHATEQQLRKPYDDNIYHKASHQNQSKQLTEVGTNANHANFNKRNNVNLIQQHNLEHDTSNQYQPSKSSSQYHQTEKIPTHLNYKDTKYSEESSLDDERTPYNKNNDYVPQTRHLSGHSDFRSSGHFQDSRTVDSGTQTSHHQQDVPTDTHQPKSNPYYQSPDDSSTPISYNRKNIPTHLHDPKPKHYHTFPSDSNTGVSHKKQNPPTHLHEFKSTQHPQSSIDHREYENTQNHRNGYHEQLKQDSKHLSEQNDPMQQQSVSYREPTSHTELLNDRESESKTNRRLTARRENAVSYRDSINNQQEPPAHQHRSNTMRVVESQKDMKPLPSEVDTSLNEEHDGFLDMGAYTDKQGSFGWYADFPVGKEHDKVTYSFSK